MWALVQFYPIDVGARPDQGLPGYGRPDQGLPGWSGPVDPGYGQGGPNYPSQGLPGWGGRPDQGLPGQGGRPDQGLPGQPLPPHISNRPPGSSGGHPSQGLPGGGYPSGQPVPPGVATPMGVAAATAPPASVDTEKGAWVLVAIGGGQVVWAWAQQSGAAPAPPPSGENKPVEPRPPHVSGQPVPPTATPQGRR